MTNTYTDIAKQLIINDITDVDISTVTFNTDELYLAPDNAVYSVNNITPVNGNVTLDAANKDLSNISTTGNAKFQAPITGGASTITSSNLTANKALISNASGKVAVSSVTSSELGYLFGVTSNVQTQLNGKQETLVSGTNIKTINSTSLLGSGNIAVGTVTSVNNTSPDANGDVTITIPDPLPSQTGNSGKFLTTDGSATSWATVDALPSQSGQSGKYLTTNGTSASWGSISIPTKISDLTDDTATYPIDQADVLTNQRTGVVKLWTGTKAQYDAITTKDANTLYNITDDIDVTLTLLNTIYPVGSIYIGTMATCPLATLGIGTWQLVATDRVLQGAGTRGSVGSTVNESLPNITGNPGLAQAAGSPSGAFYSGSSLYTSAYSASSNYTTVAFDASRSSSTYQDDAPVQQDAYLVNIWERVA